jgi:hypothetical protein
MFTTLHLILWFRLETQDYDDVCEGKPTAIEEENHVYQTLKPNEMNYESMYAKITPTKEN